MGLGFRVPGSYKVPLSSRGPPETLLGYAKQGLRSGLGSRGRGFVEVGEPASRRPS